MVEASLPADTLKASPEVGLSPSKQPSSLKKKNKVDEVDIPILEVDGVHAIPSGFVGLKLVVECQLKTMGMTCDLDLNLLCYDERARFIEKIDVVGKQSKDGSCELTKDRNSGDFLQFTFKIDFKRVKYSTTAILLYLDGGPRNFQYLQSMQVLCIRVLQDEGYGNFLPSEFDSQGKNAPFLKLVGRTRKNYQGLASCMIYKDGWQDEDKSSHQWMVKSFLDAVYETSKKEKEDHLVQLIVGAVPSLDRYRPRLFSNVKEICAALSSHALPKLKWRFQKNSEGLLIQEFIDVLFKQLFETHPKVRDEVEAAYTVAMLQEMFYQIDYNGDHFCNWDEFTTFCVQTGVVTTGGGGGAAGPSKQQGDNTVGGDYSLEQYVIEYGEDFLYRDRVLSAYRDVVQMRYVPENRKILLLPEESDCAFIFDERFHLFSHMYPSKLQIVSSVNKSDATPEVVKGSGGHTPKAVIYDMVYLSKRDLYAYTSSDHSITVVKEVSTMGGKKINYLQFNRFFHTLLHLRLCWSPKHDTLCSAASDCGIYGWNIDLGTIVFQISRHSDNITDFIAVDHLNVFITCAMDKKIVMWSSTSRRVKGIFTGHQRGVRSLSVYESLLLSAGFECNALLWDLSSRENIAILKGHRHPIVCAKLMCQQAQAEKENRAITVDEFGEFRLWNIHVQERGSEAKFAPTIQLFSMAHPEPHLSRFRFLALPYNLHYSTSYYSNIVACSSKLMHFVPEKNTKDFIPPSASVFNEAASTIITAVGKNVLTFDISNGSFSEVFENVSSSDITSLCMDGERGRRMYVGNNAGELLLINSMNGSLIDLEHYHTKDVTSIQQVMETRSSIFTSGMDGHLRLFEECNGKLLIHNSADNIFGEGTGITVMRVCPAEHVLVAASAKKSWGIWSDITLKKILIVNEEEAVTAIEAIPSYATSKVDAKTPSQSAPAPATSNLLTFAVVMQSGISIYTLDYIDIRGVKSFQLMHSKQLYITHITFLRSPDAFSVNYTTKTAKSQYNPGFYLIGATDEGTLVVWDTANMKAESENIFKGMLSSGKMPAGLANKLAKSSSVMRLSIPQQTRPTSTTSPARLVSRKSNDVDGHLSRSFHDVEDDVSSTAEHFLAAGGKGPGPGHGHMSSSKNSPSNPLLQGQSTGSKKPSKASNPFFLTGVDQSATAAIATTTATSKYPTSNLDLSVDSTSSQAHLLEGSNLWVEMDSSRIFEKPPAGSGGVQRHICSFQGHSDSISVVLPLNTHSCFCTAALDGFQRVWNLDLDFLGELVLPNVSEAMKKKAMSLDPGSGWSFILERIPVSKTHTDIARMLLRSLSQSHKDRLLEQQLSHQERRNATPAGFKGFAPEDIPEAACGSKAEQLRREMLQSLVEADPPAPDKPPTRMPTKEEKELLKLSLSLEAYSIAATSAPGNDLMSPAKAASPTELGLKAGSPSASTLLPSQSHVLGFAASSSPPKLGGSSALFEDKAAGEAAAADQKKVLRELKKALIGKSISFLASADASDVCMSALGIPSLWSVPGEKDIFGQRTGMGASSSQDTIVPPAFSDLSLKNMLREGLIDVEAQRILRRVSKNEDNVSVYERSQPTLLVRSPSMSTSVTLPSLDNLRRTEVKFGVQKDMYKNAEKVLNSKENVTKTQIRNSIAKARIDLNVRKINTMVHLIQPPSHDEVILPKTLGEGATHVGLHADDLNKFRSEDQKMKLRLLKSAALVPVEARERARPLDPDSIDKWIHKAKLADEFGDKRDGKKKKAKKKEVLSQVAVNNIESRLRAAIRAEFRARTLKLQQKSGRPSSAAADIIDAAGDPGAETVASEDAKVSADDKKVAISTRALLPYYTMDSVNQFLDIFAKVDENFSGDLDIHEWIRLFTSLDESIPVQEARMIFMKLDVDNDGFLTMNQLVPIVFSKASRDQIQLITRFCEAQVSKTLDEDGVYKIPMVDMDQLFEAYDAVSIGFVEVSLVKERLRSMRLSEKIMFHLMESMKDYQDDEMVSLVEFRRLFKAYTAKKA